MLTPAFSLVSSDVITRLSYASVEALLLEMAEASPVRRAAGSIVDTVTSAFGFASGWGSLKKTEQRMGKLSQREGEWL